MIHFRVEGKARGKERPKATTIHGHARMYTPKATRQYEEEVRQAFTGSNHGAVPVYEKDRSLRLTLLIACKVPKSYTKKMRQACLDGELQPTKKPDVDNIVKVICDALNGYAFTDDSQVTMVYAEKYYSEEDYVDVTISPIGKDD